MGDIKVFADFSNWGLPLAINSTAVVVSEKEYGFFVISILFIHIAFLAVKK